MHWLLFPVLYMIKTISVSRISIEFHNKPICDVFKWCAWFENLPHRTLQTMQKSFFFSWWCRDSELTHPLWQTHRENIWPFAKHQSPGSLWLQIRVRAASGKLPASKRVQLNYMESGPRPHANADIVNMFEVDREQDCKTWCVTKPGS